MLKCTPEIFFLQLHPCTYKTLTLTTWIPRFHAGVVRQKRRKSNGFVLTYHYIESTIALKTSNILYAERKTKRWWKKPKPFPMLPWSLCDYKSTFLNKQDILA